jgi:hypothetical protein
MQSSLDVIDEEKKAEKLKAKEKQREAAALANSKRKPAYVI